MWHSLRIQGRMHQRDGSYPITVLMGQASLTALLDRLRERLERGIDGSEGTFGNGLKAALAAQMVLCQWGTVEAFRRCERDAGEMYPLMSTLLRHAHSYGSSLPGGSTAPASPDCPPT